MGFYPGLDAIFELLFPSLCLILDDKDMRRRTVFGVDLMSSTQHSMVSMPAMPLVVPV